MPRVMHHKGRSPSVFNQEGDERSLAHSPTVAAQEEEEGESRGGGEGGAGEEAAGSSVSPTTITSAAGRSSGRRGCRRAEGRQGVTPGMVREVITFGRLARLLVDLLIARLGAAKDARAVRRVRHFAHGRTHRARQQLQPGPLGQLF